MEAHGPLSAVIPAVKRPQKACMIAPGDQTPIAQEPFFGIQPVDEFAGEEHRYGAQKWRKAR